jgi:pyruvate/2-oxoacid:ferredoxin oxidoreductase beta subunit
MSQIMIKDAIPREELMDPGHLACPGCGAALAMRLVLKGLGEKTIVSLPACCWTIVAGPWPQSSLHVPLFHTAFETAAAAASGIKAALTVRGDHETTVLAWAGDGGTFDIGLQALSGAAERNEDIIYCCYDNEAYMNTGIQRSSATPWGAWTTTTPAGHPESHPKKDIMAIMAAHRVPYAATACIAYPDDLMAKVRRAKATRGTRFLHILAPCPPGWKTEDEESIEIARMAVQRDRKSVV